MQLNILDSLLNIGIKGLQSEHNNWMSSHRLRNIT